MGENYVLPIEQTRVTRQQAKVQQIIEETDAKAQEIIQNAQNQSQIAYLRLLSVFHPYL